MGKQRIKSNYRRRVPRLPDLDHCKLAVLNTLGSPASRRVYEYAIDHFIAWYCSEPRLAAGDSIRRLLNHFSINYFSIAIFMLRKYTSDPSH